MVAMPEILKELGDDKVTLQGFDIRKMVKIICYYFMRVSKGANTRLLEYTMSTPFDLRTISLVTSGGIELEDETSKSETVWYLIRWNKTLFT